MTEFAGCRNGVGANLDMHRHPLHALAKGVNGLDVVAHQQDSDSCCLRWRKVFPARRCFSYGSGMFAHIARASGISISPCSKASTNASTTVGSKLAPAPEAMISLA